MIIGTGIDIVEVARIRKSMEKNDGFAKLVFDPEELAYCKKQAASFQSFAGRFAAKEAFFKALGSGWSGDLAFHEVCIFNDALGKPYIQLKGATQQALKDKENCSFHLSISHTEHYATAFVILETAS
ncbi:holo-ACP synthase [Catalinimonas niigatensis]|uniref:holo-ACP synthase n=1 Tax=Catalinimonas niigatensis TaxID=1397264 RepID=UPI0026671F3B|nr:holo-ACP synthase [Catalinimonas niigatensis]WPP48777.1 holo-ACP synthase [Catalinimonas niigatensis]